MSDDRRPPRRTEHQENERAVALLVAAIRKHRLLLAELSVEIEAAIEQDVPKLRRTGRAAVLVSGLICPLRRRLSGDPLRVARRRRAARGDTDLLIVTPRLSAWAHHRVPPGRQTTHRRPTHRCRRRRLTGEEDTRDRAYARSRTRMIDAAGLIATSDHVRVFTESRVLPALPTETAPS